MSHSDPIFQPPLDTIAAISTPPGRGGIGIVRLSGPDALSIAAKLVRTEAPLEHAHARFGTVLDPDAAGLGSDPGSASGVDEALTTAFLAPRSYTGEDLVEIAAHGSPVILQAVLQGALARGARLARPGEFTERAFLSGRLDLTQAEAVHDLIAAQTLDQARTAARQLGGSLSRRLAPIKEDLLHLIALLEAGMDFASGELDDVEAVPPQQIEEALHSIMRPLRELTRGFRAGYLRRSGAGVALIGPPNAGKSSLFNRLLERDRAIVTPISGTTRDTLEESFSVRGIPLRLMDTAGLRAREGDAPGEEAPGEVERLGITRSREALADADLVLLLHDATEPLSDEERALARDLVGRPHLLLDNKVDLPAAEPRWAPLAQETRSRTVTASALTGAGLDELRDAIVAELGVSGEDGDGAGLNNLRQQEAVGAALAALESATEANASQLPHELLLLDLHAALAALDSLTGATTTDDILARIFSTFCIGK